MTTVKNQLPVAVHQVSGGDARVRTGGLTISLTDINGGSFQVENGTRYRIVADLRTYSTLMLLIGYTCPVTQSNASLVCVDLDEVFDDVEEGTTVYFSVVDTSDLAEVSCTAYDKVHISFYG
ncbi:MAG: hypothetical protein ABFD49_08670 [Armatimonadota bacterium]|nr:hypothetical protein [bacterium]